MVSKHSQEEDIILNNYSCLSSSESDNCCTSDDDEDNEGEGTVCKPTGGGFLPNFIYNDLKNMRHGGPLMDNEKGGATASAAATGPVTLKCRSCKKDARKLMSPRWFKCECWKDEGPVCEKCFSRPQCIRCKKTRQRGYEVEKDKTDEKKSEKEKLTIWKSGDPKPDTYK